MHLQINDLAHPVAVDRAPEVVDVLAAITSGWSIRPGDPAAEPAIRVVRRRGRYGISTASRQGTRRQPTAVSAACSLVVDLVEAMADTRPDMLCLHAGAVRLGDGLVVFPSRRRAGKSTLIARLASRGVEVFADDVLPLVARDDGIVAHAFGVASRLRLPLPPTLPADLHRWSTDHAGPADAWYRYLDPAPGRLAPYGTEANVRAFVFLDRGPDDARPRLHRAPEAAALEALLLQNFGIAATAGEILGRIVRLSATAGLYVLRYGALDPAVELLLDRFSGEALPAAATELPLPLPPHQQPHDKARPVCGPALDGLLCRAPGLAVRTIHGRPFIGNDEDGAIFALDGVGAAVWALLDEPITLAEITEALTETFPEVAPPVIRADVAAFALNLRARRLVAHQPQEFHP